MRQCTSHCELWVCDECIAYHPPIICHWCYGPGADEPYLPRIPDATRGDSDVPVEQAAEPAAEEWPRYETREFLGQQDRYVFSERPLGADAPIEEEPSSGDCQSAVAQGLAGQEAGRDPEQLPEPPWRRAAAEESTQKVPRAGGSASPQAKYVLILKRHWARRVE